jgi:hypothetical protein
VIALPHWEAQQPISIQDRLTVRTIRASTCLARSNPILPRHRPKLLPNYPRRKTPGKTPGVINISGKDGNADSIRLYQREQGWMRRLKDVGSKWKKLENQKVSFVTFVVTIFYSSYYTKVN